MTSVWLLGFTFAWSVETGQRTGKPTDGASVSPQRSTKGLISMLGAYQTLSTQESKVQTDP